MVHAPNSDVHPCAPVVICTTVQATGGSHGPCAAIWSPADTPRLAPSLAEARIQAAQQQLQEFMGSVEPLCASVLEATGRDTEVGQLPASDSFELRLLKRFLLQLERALPEGAITTEEHFNRWAAAWGGARHYRGWLPVPMTGYRH
jgi:hypothetical protein